jgi:hypothetical protein
MEAQDDTEPEWQAVLEPGEEIRCRARATDAILAVTDRRLVVAASHRIPLAIPFEGLRRVQFDIERERPATLVLVPELARHAPQVLEIPPQQYHTAAEALVALGLALAPIDSGAKPE